MSSKVVEVIRGDIVESLHRGSIAVVSSEGRLMYKLGTPERLTFFRSAAKPFIAITALECGIFDKYKLTLKEIAVMSSSHSGEKKHQDVLRSIMGKLGIGEEQLKCGAHEPICKTTAKELYLKGMEPSSIHCNCSGKHLAVIAAVKSRGLPVEDYYRFDHPIQELIKKVISEFSSTNISNIAGGIDGCGIRIYGVPLKNMALAYANLCSKSFMNGKYRKSQQCLIDAMTSYPEMVAGTDRLDNEMMKAYGDRIICKAGAEGVYCAGILDRTWGIALKIEDGNNRAAEPVILETVLQTGIITEKEMELLKKFWKPPLKNHKNEQVGIIKPVFNLVSTPSHKFIL